ncbi:MAG: hypothetical protein QGG63_01435 [Candidatus Pacebacteria bacterium]|jgi:hypothetical protein|nr:hypothetical protein [Candidatus Paceibacterota bacterium]|tara:strand:+ start:4979 stop:5443 length:465 start_codon:yes stop_codon:yes gene_type:complete
MAIQLQWSAFEHEHIHKNSDWFWALGIVAIAGAVMAIIFNNILFAIVILLGAFVLGIHASKRPNRVDFKIIQRGIVIGNVLHPYSSLESFWVEDVDENTAPKLLIKSKKLLAPHIIIPIEDVSPNDVRNYLLEYLVEEEDSESLVQKIMEFFGF